MTNPWILFKMTGNRKRAYAVVNDTLSPDDPDKSIPYGLRWKSTAEYYGFLLSMINELEHSANMCLEESNSKGFIIKWLIAPYASRHIFTTITNMRDVVTRCRNDDLRMEREHGIEYREIDC